MGRTSGNELKNNRLADGDIFLCQPLFFCSKSENRRISYLDLQKRRREGFEDDYIGLQGWNEA